MPLTKYGFGFDNFVRIIIFNNFQSVRDLLQFEFFGGHSLNNFTDQIVIVRFGNFHVVNFADVWRKIFGHIVD